MSPLCLLVRQAELQAGMAAPDGWLSAGERARLQAFSNASRRDSFLAGRWLTRLAVQRLRGTAVLPMLDVAASGAPEVAGGGCVSISHSGDWVAAAVGDAPLGIDIEAVARPRDFAALARALWSDRAHEAWSAASFLREWTLREAWLKAHGRGLDWAALRELSFEVGADPGDAAHADIGPVALAIVTPGRRCEPQLADWPAPVWVRSQSKPTP